MNLMKKAAVSRHTCSTLSAQQDLPVSFICLAIHPFIYLSVHLFFYLFTQLSVHIPIPSVPVRHHLPIISPSITTLVNKDTSRIDIVFNWPDRSLSCIQGSFIFRELIRGLKTGNLIKWLPWFKRMAACVCVSMLKIGLWRAVAKWIMLKQIFILLGYCPVFSCIKPSAFRATKKQDCNPGWKTKGRFE